MFSIARRTLVGLLIAGVSVFAIACGDDGGGSNNGGGGTSGFSSGVDGEVSAGELSADQEDAMCSAYESYASSQVSESEAEELGCTLSGVMGAAFAQPETDEEAQQACTTAYDDCMNSDEEGGEEGTCQFRDVSEDCTATVAEIEACKEVQYAKSIEALRAMPSCDELTLEDLQADDGESETPTECQPVEEKCSELL